MSGNTLEKPYLQIFVLYHKESKIPPQFLKDIFRLFTRDHENPLYRTLGIQIYFFDSCQNEVTKDYIIIDLNSAKHTIIICLVDYKMKLDQNWGDYLNRLWKNIKNFTFQHRLILIAMDETSLNISKELENINFIRFYEFEKKKRTRILKISILNTICQILKNDFNDLKEKQDLQPIKLFLSHAKIDGINAAEKIRDYINSETQIDSFFDFNKIPYGMDIMKVIEKNINNSCFIAIQTDKYSTREWCRCEILSAKLKNSPLIVINCLNNKEDRSFPYMGNVPTIRWNLKKNDRIIDIILLALYEMLKSLYNKGYLNNFCKYWNTEENLFLSYRAPEILTSFLATEEINKQKNIILLYPDPPIGFEEINLLKKILPNVKNLTPTQLLEPSENLKSDLADAIIGISISDSPDLPIHGLTEDHLIDLFIEISRYLLASKVRVAYGGDLRKYGFTEILFNLTREYIIKEKKLESRVFNYLSWPFYRELKEEHEAYLKDVAIIKKIDLPEDLLNDSGKKKIQFNKLEDRYLVARALAKMRIQMNNDIQCRIIIAGNTTKFSGKYPGLVEEAYLALNSKKPVFLVGAFGGAAELIIQALKGESHGFISLQNRLKTTNYEEFLNYYNQQITENPKIKEEPIDLIKIIQFFNATGVKGLNNGLTKEENLKLFESTHINEIVRLILKGLKLSKLM